MGSWRLAPGAEARRGFLNVVPKLVRFVDVGLGDRMAEVLAQEGLQAKEHGAVVAAAAALDVAVHVLRPRRELQPMACLVGIGGEDGVAVHVSKLLGEQSARSILHWERRRQVLSRGVRGQNDGPGNIISRLISASATTRRSPGLDLPPGRRRHPATKNGGVVHLDDDNRRRSMFAAVRSARADRRKRGEPT
jgi:hypothetical protein